MKLFNAPLDLEVCIGMRVANTSLGFLGRDPGSCVSVIDEVEGLLGAFFLDRDTGSWISVIDKVEELLGALFLDRNTGSWNSVIDKVRGLLGTGFLPRGFLEIQDSTYLDVSV